MFDWLHHHQDSPELAHAKQRQQERDASLNQRDPLSEYEVIHDEALQVQELSAEEFANLIHNLKRPEK